MHKLILSWLIKLSYETKETMDSFQVKITGLFIIISIFITVFQYFVALKFKKILQKTEMC